MGVLTRYGDEQQFLVLFFLQLLTVTGNTTGMFCWMSLLSQCPDSVRERKAE